jgi:glycosyltransferase involved in cell wall biosynthesis
MKIAIIDKLGLCYDGDTLTKQGLGGSESAVILIAKHLQTIGFEVTVFNNCKDGLNSSPGEYDGVRYIDNTEAKTHTEKYDIVVVSRTVAPFISQDWPFLHTAKKRILWLHDTFIEGDQLMEDLAVSGKIDHIFTLSDWHTSYILTCAHGKKRNYEVLKKKIFQTRNGAVCHIPEVDLSKKDSNHFVYNASATKGMIPLVEDIWPEIKKQMPGARLTVIGGYYRFREGAEPDAQENTVAQLAQRQDLKDLDITFTGVIPQYEIAEILANAWMMLYPGAFPETFGISSLESLLYKTPLVTTRFGALEETAVSIACYHIDYAIEPNSLFPHINKDHQVKKFLAQFFAAYNIPYLHQQKQNYCDVVKDVAGWDTVALQWKQFFYFVLGEFLPVNEYRKVTRINNKVARIFSRTSQMPVQQCYSSYGEQRRIVVISPFWNAESYIEKNIRSVAQQDYNNYLHILINDASTDNSRQIAENAIKQVQTNNIVLINREQNNGAIFNQLSAIDEYVDDRDIVIFLDGDDWLVNNNTLFHYYNDLYNQGYEFTYGSMWSVVDNIPLISQEYPQSVKQTRSYRTHLFNWKIPYTHLRTVLGEYAKNLDHSVFKDLENKWMKAGHDNPLFYELIEQVEPDRIYCNREIVCNYNDANPLNDYKVNANDQTRNANTSYKGKNTVNKKILIAVPTAKYIEVETFKSIYDLTVPEGYTVEFQYFYGYSRTQIRNLIAEWAKHYDYTIIINRTSVLNSNIIKNILSLNSDIVKIDDFCICAKRKVFDTIVQYPCFEPAETELEELYNFIQKAKKSGATVSHLTNKIKFLHTC